MDGTITFPRGSRVGGEDCIQIEILADGESEPTEMFSVTLTDTSGLNDIIIHEPLTINVTISDCKWTLQRSKIPSGGLLT